MLEITGVKFKCGNFSSQIWDDSRHRRFLIFYRKMWVLNKSVVQRRERWAENQGLCGPKWVLHSVKFLRTSLGTALTGPIPAPVSRCQWTEWSFENLTQILSLLCSLPNGFFFFFFWMASYLFSLFPSHCRHTELPLSMKHPNHPLTCKLFQEVYNCMILESACNAGDPGLIPESGRYLGEGNGNPLQYSGLENPMDGRVWWAAVHGVTQSWARLSDWSPHRKLYWPGRDFSVVSAVRSRQVPQLEVVL